MSHTYSWNQIAKVVEGVALTVILWEYMFYQCSSFD